jgi:hypothetical protein
MPFPISGVWEENVYLLFIFDTPGQVATMTVFRDYHVLDNAMPLNNFPFD